MKLLAIDIGGSAIKYGVYQNQSMDKVSEIPTPASRSEFLEALVKIKQEYPDETFAGCAISCPGKVNEEKGSIGGLSFVPYLHFLPIKEEIEQALDMKVSMMNDAHCAAYAEMKLGVGIDATNPLFVIIGSGIGVAWAKQGQLIVSTDEMEDKLKQYLVDLIRSYKGLSASAVQSAKILGIKKLEGPASYDGKDMYDLANQGDLVAQEQIATMYRSLGEVLMALQLSLQPEFIALGGGITNNPQFFKELQEILDQLSKDQPFIIQLLSWLKQEERELNVDLRLCVFKSESNLIGASLHFLDLYKN